MPYIRLKLKQNKLSMTWVIKRWNSSHKSGSALKQGVPGLFFLASGLLFLMLFLLASDHMEVLHWHMLYPE